jgi:hypothetical protein
MDTIKKEIINGFKFFYYDKEWQRPVVTEEQTFRLFYDNKNIPCNYFAFPWAEFIDNKIDLKTFKSIFDNFTVGDQPCFTVVQHINFEKILRLCKHIGITHVFTPHKKYDESVLQKKYQINILGYPLYPVQHNSNPIIKDIEYRKYFASFIGNYEKYYLTKVREQIFHIFSKYSDCFVKKRENWHYNDMVYKRKKNITNVEFENEYKINLADSIFSLCPSGSGPNSIRIWESMSFGCIPVILADTLDLPEIKGLNYDDIFITWPEKDIDILYEYLKSLDKELITKMINKNVEVFNKYFSKDKMNMTILDYFINKKLN